MECGGFLKGFGKDVTILYRSQVLRNFDQDIVSRIVEYMENDGVKFQKGSPVKFEKNGEKIVVTLTTEEGEIT